MNTMNTIRNIRGPRIGNLTRRAAFLLAIVGLLATSYPAVRADRHSAPASTLAAAPAANVQIVKVLPRGATAGSVTYHITVTNNGGVTSTVQTMTGMVNSVDWNGKAVAPLYKNAQVPVLAPGASYIVSMEFTGERHPHQQPYPLTGGYVTLGSQVEGLPAL